MKSSITVLPTLMKCQMDVDERNLLISQEIKKETQPTTIAPKMPPERPWTFWSVRRSANAQE